MLSMSTSDCVESEIVNDSCLCRSDHVIVRLYSRKVSSCYHQCLLIQAAVPLFAYSDIDKVEISLMAEKIQEVEYKKGYSIAKIGQTVTPAIYIVRSGKIVSILFAIVLCLC